ncbi:MAG: hypothetical protein L3J69_00145 [Desulfobacula sp.]|nr:hypothetical protein [Desulfobacula sp.]
MKTKDILEGCSGSFRTIDQDQTVEKALQLLSGFWVSGLVVTTGDPAHD